MRNCVPFLLLALAPYAGAETLPRFLNSNDSMQTLPTPILPVDAYRPAAPALELPKPAAAQPRPLEMVGPSNFPLVAPVYEIQIGR